MPLKLRIINLAWLAQQKKFVQIFLGKRFFQQKLFMRILSEIQPAGYLAFFISDQLTSFTHPKHVISGYLHWRNNLYNYETQFDMWIQRLQHIFEQSYTSFLLQQNQHPLPWKKKKIINTLVFIRVHIVLVFSALFCLFIVTPFSVLFIIWYDLILPLDMNKLKIHPRSLYFM